MIEYRKEVDELLKSYAEYKKLLNIESTLSLKLARQKINGTVDTKLVDEHSSVKTNLQNLSDSMTFSNPFVWITYKFEAYKDEAQPIRTMRDFRIHCSKEAYICTKRFTFINEQLAVRGQQPLLNTAYYSDETSLDKLIDNTPLQNLIDDPAFSELWQTHEYTTMNNQVAKWENYKG